VFNPLKLALNKPLERTHIITLTKKLDENENFLDNRKNKYSASSHQREIRPTYYKLAL